MCSFQCWYHQSVFQKKQLLYLRWLLASLLWVSYEGFNFACLFDRNVGLTTKCVMVKVSKNVLEEEPLSQIGVDMTNTKNETLVECVKKNSRRLICLTNQLEILYRAASRSLVGGFSSTPISLLLIETQLLLKIALNFFEYQFFELRIPSIFMLWTCSVPPPRIT